MLPQGDGLVGVELQDQDEASLGSLKMRTSWRPEGYSGTIHAAIRLVGGFSAGIILNY